MADINRLRPGGQRQRKGADMKWSAFESLTVVKIYRLRRGGWLYEYGCGHSEMRKTRRPRLGIPRSPRPCTACKERRDAKRRLKNNLDVDLWGRSRDALPRFKRFRKRTPLRG